MGSLSRHALPVCLLVGATLASCQVQDGDAAVLDSPDPEVLADESRSGSVGTSAGVSTGTSREPASHASVDAMTGDAVDVAGATSDSDGAHWRREILGELPWVEPFVEDETFRRVLLLAWGINPNSVAVGDMDDDGDLDLLWAQTARDRLIFFPQIAPQSFSPSPVIIGSTVWTDGPFAVTAGDVDGDGRHDAVSYNAMADDVTVFYQIALGVYAPTPSVLTAPAGMQAYAVHAEDLDTDGDVDISTCVEDGAVVATFEQVRPKKFVYSPDLD